MKRVSEDIRIVLYKIVRKEVYGPHKEVYNKSRIKLYNHISDMVINRLNNVEVQVKETYEGSI
jgi:hypothetical protein